MNKCNYCGGSNFYERILFQPEITGQALLHYRKKPDGWLYGSETVMVDMCKDCGTISRMYVDNVREFWEFVEKKEQSSPNT